MRVWLPANTCPAGMQACEPELWILDQTCISKQGGLVSLLQGPRSLWEFLQRVAALVRTARARSSAAAKVDMSEGDQEVQSEAAATADDS